MKYEKKKNLKIWQPYYIFTYLCLNQFKLHNCAYSTIYAQCTIWQHYIFSPSKEIGIDRPVHFGCAQENDNKGVELKGSNLSSLSFLAFLEIIR